jgi:uncharacterized protein (TIGR03437 family)
MFVFGDSSTIAISSLTNAASGQPGGAPGMTAALVGTGLGQNKPSITVNGLPAAVKSVNANGVVFQIPYETGVGPAVVGVNNNGSIAGYLFSVAPSSPGIYSDANGNLTPVATVVAGKALAFTMTGDGYIPVPDGYAASGNSLTYKPQLPFTVTVGGTPVFVNSYGLASGAVGVTTVNVTIPTTAPAGPQPVVVTVNGVASPPVNVTVTAAP